MWSEHRFISFDETPIFYRVCKASALPRAVFMIIHGMGEHSGRYQAIAEYLSALGVQSYLPDLRGFGQSGGPKAFVRHFSDFHKDTEALHAFIRRTHPRIPFFLLGHSFGGLVASSYVSLENSSGVHGLILSSPIFGIAIPVPLWRHTLALALSYLFPRYSQESHVTARLLTHDCEIIKAYERDPLIHHRITACLYRELVFMIYQKIRIAQNICVPTLILQAGEDRVVSRDATLSFYEAIKAADNEIKIYPNFYHEVLNETERSLVFSKIESWLLKRLLL